MYSFYALVAQRFGIARIVDAPDGTERVATTGRRRRRNSLQAGHASPAAGAENADSSKGCILPILPNSNIASIINNQFMQFMK